MNSETEMIRSRLKEQRRGLRRRETRILNVSFHRLALTTAHKGVDRLVPRDGVEEIEIGEPVLPDFGAGPFHVATRDEEFLGDMFGGEAIAMEDPGPPVARGEDCRFSRDINSEPINVFGFHMGEILAGGSAMREGTPLRKFMVER